MGCFKAASVRPYSMLFKRSFTKEVSPWLSLSVKCPRLVAISVVAPTGSSLLPALRFAPSAVNPSCPTELARLAAPTMAVRSWPLRRSKAKAENAEEGLVPSSFSFLAAVPPDNDARGLYQYAGSLTRPVTYCTPNCEICLSSLKFALTPFFGHAIMFPTTVNGSEDFMMTMMCGTMRFLKFRSLFYT